MAREYYVRSEDGFYYIDLGTHGGVFKTPLTPVDATNMVTWADTLIEAAQDAINMGFGQCVDGTPYDLNNFLCDTHGGSVPWDISGMKDLYAELVKHPKFESTMLAFEAKYGDIHFPLTWNDYMADAGYSEADQLEHKL
jgi:hypothetical protein